MLPTFLQKSGHVYVNFSAKWESDCHTINTKTSQRSLEGAAHEDENKTKLKRLLINYRQSELKSNPISKSSNQIIILVMQSQAALEESLFVT